ncbi:hypothetical protein NEMBOFW57_008265 [Staphylotrichum longicolle]|uniref:Uncharacterized protein n=1 Tax=Staphylotrichum longicolle TaxID=669026 RepID=A0AAD4ERF9_9PEZI|nr:hypothetical protein NEMBOFW57_008265 [Staphylotrichum longicolle]
MLNSTRTLLGHAKLARARILARAAHSLGISDHKKLQWVPIGAAQDVLLVQLKAMFWDSVECELKEIIRTLRGWQAADLNDVELEDEANVEIYGFDTFIDQVSESSREFSVEYAKEKARSLRRTVKGEFVPSDHRLQALARQFCANNTSKRLKEEIAECLKARPVEPDIWRRRARLLLQSAGWLDVDKFIQHRPPLEEVGFWKRPTPPQRLPARSPPHNHNHHHCDEPNLADHHLSKQYKTSPLTPAAIPPATSRAICRCTTVARSDEDGRLRAVFPVRRGVDRHRTAPAPCGLLALGDAVAEAKYLGVRGGQGKKGETLDEERRRAERALEAERARRDGGGKGGGGFEGRGVDDEETDPELVAGRTGRDRRRGTRYKTALKQVVGGLFAGVCLEQLEAEIVGLVLAASRKGLDHDDDNAWQQRVRWKEVLGPIERKLHDLMDGRVARMLGSVVERLLDPGVKLRWDRQDNNCQMFCDALIDSSLYRGLVPTTRVEGIPPYLMSFVCHPDGYRRERKVQTKHDVPSGLCEEYLLKFRFGFHLDSDIIDTLHEYWHDWGNFGGPLYPHQPMFPWDCTEAYGRSPVRCGNCNTAKHAWAFPFDSWSMAELHSRAVRSCIPVPPPQAMV